MTNFKKKVEPVAKNNILDFNVTKTKHKGRSNKFYVTIRFEKKITELTEDQAGQRVKEVTKILAQLNLLMNN